MRPLERHAARCARGVPRDQRAEVRLEIRGHLQDLVAEARRRGLDPRAARRAAIDAFGDGSRICRDLHRAARGRRIVQFPSGLRGWLRSFLIYDLRPLIIVLALVALLRWQVVGIYHIPSKSMEPTLIGRREGGDRIVVDMLTYSTFRKIPFLRSLATEIHRWDVLVFRNDVADENFIKRVTGLPGDRLQLSHGDLFVNGRVATKDESVREAMLISLVRPADDEPDHLVETWSRTGGTWTTEPRRLVVTAETGQVATIEHPRLRTWYLDHEDKKQEPDRQMVVLDLRLSVDATWRDGDGAVVLVAGQEGALAELEVPGGSGAAILRFDGHEVGRADGVALEPGVETRLRLSRIDGVVHAEVGSREILSHDLDWTIERAESYSAGPCRAALRVRSGVAALRAVRIDRDVHYNRIGNLAATDGFVVPDGHYFMMGDNSENSTDSRSREYGPFPEEKIIGKPHLVFWPPSRWRPVR